jgi:CRISPR-associated protein Cmr5
MVIAHGLGQSLAVIRANSQKNDDTRDAAAYSALYQHCANWLCRPDHGVFPNATEKTLLEAIVHCHWTEYMRAQSELLSYLGWLKKFAEALLTEDREGPDHG